MNRILEDIFAAVFIIFPWLAGIAIAKGADEIAIAIIFPPYAWYLFVERILIVSGLLG